MPLPFSWRGSIDMAHEPTGAADTGAALDQIESALEAVSPSRLHRDASALVFRGGAFRLVNSWNLLVPISSGRVQVEGTPAGMHIAYELHFTGIVVVTTVIVACLAAGLVWAEGESIPLAARVVAPIAIWLWLVGGNVATALVRFPRFLRRAVAHRPGASTNAR